MQIHITARDAVLPATLLENATAREVIGHLPLTLTLTNYAGTEKISQLPERLQTTNAPPGVKPQSGDITYYTPVGQPRHLLQ